MPMPIVMRVIQNFIVNFKMSTSIRYLKKIQQVDTHMHTRTEFKVDTMPHLFFIKILKAMVMLKITERRVYMYS